MQSPVAQEHDGQAVVVEIANPGATGDARIRKNKKVLRALGVTEAVFGIICSILGITVLSHAYGKEDNVNDPCFYGSSSYLPYYYPCPQYTSYYSYRWNIGEGLWGGVWIIIAGSLGVACGKKTVTTCLVNCHMAFSIVAAIFSGAMFSTALPVAATYRNYSFGVGVEVTIAVLSFITLVLCIASASMCCCAPPVNMGSSNCCACCSGQNQLQSQPMPGANVMYVRNNQGLGQMQQQTMIQTVPYLMQGIPNTTIPGTVYLQAAPHQQPHQVVVQPAANSHMVEPGNQQRAATQDKSQEMFNAMGANNPMMENEPPSYDE